MKHVDWVQIALYANLAAICIAMLTAVVLAWNNAGSKNIPLAAAALSVDSLLKYPPYNQILTGKIGRSFAVLLERRVGNLSAVL